MKYTNFLFLICALFSSGLQAGRFGRPFREELAKRAAALRARQARRLMPARTVPTRTAPLRPREPVREPAPAPEAPLRRPVFREAEPRLIERTRPLPPVRERPRVMRTAAEEEAARKKKLEEEAARKEAEQKLEEQKREQRRLIEERVKARRAVIEVPIDEEEEFVEEQEEEIQPVLPPIPVEEEAPVPKIREIIKEHEELLWERLGKLAEESPYNRYDIQMIGLLDQYGGIIKDFLQKPNKELITLKMPTDWAFDLEPIKSLIDAFNRTAILATEPQDIEAIKQRWLAILKRDSKRLAVPIGF